MWKLLCFLIYVFAFTVSDASETFHSRTKRFDWKDDGLVNWATNCEISKNDLYNLPTHNAQDCGTGCAATQGCSAFTWTNLNGGTCYLKRGSISTGQATSKTGAVCGVVKAFTGTLGGITTRYWDCCKPSCSWNGKASVSRPAATCQKNGVTTESNVNAQSGCNGGTAFSCNNQQPFKAFNDSLSYGFAAVALQGTTEAQTCCQCYALKFNNGKMMIIQAINTGGDVAHNQFDIQVPGGGVGIFNGCQAQWGTAPDGWGQRYGGVAQRQDCNTLPLQLRSGCFWRFDWLGNNPTMNFKQVSCPETITKITGCVRT
jgi:hypothetical protein